MANTYYKFAPNVFVAKCVEPHTKGETIVLETRYGKEVENIVHNLVGTKDGFYFYSIVRADGFDHKAWCERRAEKLQASAARAESASMAAYNRSRKDSTFLSLGEPIKVGHHSERRHRRVIEQANNATAKSVELSHKAESFESRASYWESRAAEINLSMPESLDYYEHKLEAAKLRHAGLKDGTIPREHIYSLTYAKNAVNEAEKNLKLAQKLWG